MSYKIIPTKKFGKELKRLVKKYPSLKNEYTSLIRDLEKNPTNGVSLGNNCYKIRLAISSKGSGKSGGARVITHIIISEETVYLISIFDKSECENISDKEIQERLKSEIFK
jgi:mRNA-degrading endonuclease RelE of RelBE toxin-antitoxin system